MSPEDSCPVRIELLTGWDNEVKVRYSAEKDCLDYAQFLSMYYRAEYVRVDADGYTWWVEVG